MNPVQDEFIESLFNKLSDDDRKLRCGHCCGFNRENSICTLRGEVIVWELDVACVLIEKK
ncbi:MAG: hypothetical protein LUP96_05190 [Methylococcaceae bacterium]|nr:hypothetical protein [Methylococcaceae bacterium]